jgi:hypothetical protein
LLLPMIAGLAMAADGIPPRLLRPIDGSSWAQVTVRERVVIRVPRMTVRALAAGPRPALPPITWVEKKADKCVRADALAGAAVTRPDSVDLVLVGGKRVRARFERKCPALDFYSGFYMKGTRDGMICADRDVIRARSGGECRIDSFRSLVPAR